MIIYHVFFLHTDSEDYFTLEKIGVRKVLTAISESDLEIKGNIPLKWIIPKLLIIYHLSFFL